MLARMHLSVDLCVWTNLFGLVECRLLNFCFSLRIPMTPAQQHEDCTVAKHDHSGSNDDVKERRI